MSFGSCEKPWELSRDRADVGIPASTVLRLVNAAIFQLKVLVGHKYRQDGDFGGQKLQLEVISLDVAI